MPTFKDAKLFIGGVEVAEIESGSYEIDSEEPTHITAGVAHTTFTTKPIVLTQYEAQTLWLLGYYFLPSITPDGATRGACLGVFAWRMLAELQAPLHRRAAMAPFWIKAMQARYWVKPDGLPGFFVRGNQREVVAVYDRIRKEAGDFGEDELRELN